MTTGIDVKDLDTGLVALLKCLQGMPAVRRTKDTQEACSLLDQVFGPDGWHMDVSFMSPRWHWASIHVSHGEKHVERKAWSDNGPTEAFLLAYILMGGTVKWPEEPPKTKPEPQPAPASPPPPRPSGRAVGAVMPGVPVSGPVPWGLDANPTIHPALCPDPPQQPEWFKDPIGSYGAKKSTPQHKELTWEQVIRQELDNWSGRDLPLGYIRWKIETIAFDGEQKFWSAWSRFISRGKAALIWATKMRDIPRTAEPVDVGEGGSLREETGSWSEETPF